MKNQRHDDGPRRSRNAGRPRWDDNGRSRHDDGGARYEDGWRRDEASSKRRRQEIKEELPPPFREDADNSSAAKSESKIKSETSSSYGINLEQSGLLAAETNTRNGVVLKYSIPADARRPNRRWSLFMFKGDESGTKTVSLNKQKSFLIGNDVRVVDVPMMHPTVSKQHAAIVHRLVNDEIRPYIIDLESTNGTFLNESRIESARFYELKAKDILRFAKSSREFVVLPEDLVEPDEMPLEQVVHNKLKEEKETKERTRTKRYW